MESVVRPFSSSFSESGAMLTIRSRTPVTETSPTPATDSSSGLAMFSRSWASRCSSPEELAARVIMGRSSLLPAVTVGETSSGSCDWAWLICCCSSWTASSVSVP